MAPVIALGRPTGPFPLGQNGSVAERPIRVFGDPVLRTSCDAVEDFDAALISLVTDLEETVSVPGRAGLAANQIGVSRRVFAYDVDGQLGHIVNPVIEATEGEQEERGRVPVHPGAVVSARAGRSTPG